MVEEFLMEGALLQVVFNTARTEHNVLLVGQKLQ